MASLLVSHLVAFLQQTLLNVTLAAYTFPALVSSGVSGTTISDCILLLSKAECILIHVCMRVILYQMDSITASISIRWEIVFDAIIWLPLAYMKRSEEDLSNATSGDNNFSNFVYLLILLLLFLSSFISRRLLESVYGFLCTACKTIKTISENGLYQCVLCIIVFVVWFCLTTVLLMAFIFIPERYVYFHERPVIVHNAEEINTNDCITFETFKHFQEPILIYFDESDLTCNVSTYASTQRNGTCTLKEFYQEKRVISEEIIKKNIKLCKSVAGEDFVIYLRLPALETGQEFRANWKMNGSNIANRTSEYDFLSKFKSWTNTSESHVTFYLIIRRVKVEDFGLYELFIETVYIETTSIGGSEEIVVRAFRAGKLYIVNEDQREEIVVNAKVGHIVQLNNIFKYSFDFEFAKVFEPEGYRPLLFNDRRHNRKDYGFARHFREQSLEELCPVHTSCIPSIEITKGRPQLYTVENVIKNGVNTTYVNVSFCLCPDAYGFLKLYFLDKFNLRRLRTAVTVELSPPKDEFYNPEYRTLFEALSRSNNVFHDLFHYIYNNGDMFKVFISDKYRLYKYIVHGEIVAGTLFFIVYAGFQLLLTAISKRIIYVIFHFHRLHKIKLAMSNSKCWNRVYDVYLLYSDRSDNDRAMVRETLMIALDQWQLKYFDCSDDNLEGGNRTRQYRENMELSKSVLILLSQDFMDDERCLCEQVDLVLCSLIQEGIVSVSDVIVLTVDHLEQLVTPTLKLFGRIKWNDNRTEENRLTELNDKLMTVIIPRSPIFMKLDRILRVIEVYCFTEI